MFVCLFGCMWWHFLYFHLRDTFGNNEHDIRHRTNSAKVGWGQAQGTFGSIPMGKHNSMMMQSTSLKTLRIIQHIYMSHYRNRYRNDIYPYIQYYWSNLCSIGLFIHCILASRDISHFLEMVQQSLIVNTLRFHLPLHESAKATAAPNTHSVSFYILILYSQNWMSSTRTSARTCTNGNILSSVLFLVSRSSSSQNRCSLVLAQQQYQFIRDNINLCLRLQLIGQQKKQKMHTRTTLSDRMVVNSMTTLEWKRICKTQFVGIGITWRDLSTLKKDYRRCHGAWPSPKLFAWRWRWELVNWCIIVTNIEWSPSLSYVTTIHK